MFCMPTGEDPTHKPPWVNIATRALNSVPMPRALLMGVIDSGATMTAIGNRDEFVTFSDVTNNFVLKGIAKGLQIQGVGTVEYTIQDDANNDVTLRLKAYWVPKIGNELRLISPQGIRTVEGHRGSFICHTQDDTEDAALRGSDAELQFKKDEPGWRAASPITTKSLQYNPRNKLPMLSMSIPQTQERYATALSGILSVVDEANNNLSGAQKELLKWHFRLGHVGFKQLQWMIRSGRLQVPNAKAVANCVLPKCAACEFGKATRRPTKNATTTSTPTKEMELKKNDLLPGQRVSVDHYQSAVPGRLYTSKGSTDEKDMFHGGAIYVDHASGYVILRHQVSFGSSDTLRGKLEFERLAYNDGVVIQNYHTDNGVFSTKEFMGAIMEQRQQVRFSGSGAAHQNGVAERGIQTVVNMARTMMLHAAMHSPDGFVQTEH